MKLNNMNFTHTSLGKHPEYFDETLLLIEKSLNYSEKNKFEIDFYPLINQFNTHHCHILIDENKKVVAHIGFKERQLLIGKKTFPVVLIGGICVHPQLRGMGVFKSFFEESFTPYKEKSALALLWSDQQLLYEKFDFFQAGSIIQTGDKIFSIKDSPDFITKGSLNDKETFDEVKTIYNIAIKEKYLTLKRDERQWDEIFEIKSTDLYLIKRAQITDGYFFMNKGEDLNGIIHEIAFRENDEYYLDRLQQYKIWLPEHAYSKIPGSKNLYTCFIKSCNNDLFKNFVNFYTNEMINITKIDSQKVVFTFENGTLELTRSNFLQILFGPSRAQELSRLKPFFISGVDSI